MTDTDNMSLRWGRKNGRGTEVLQYANIRSPCPNNQINVSGISHCLAPSTVQYESKKC